MIKDSSRDGTYAHGIRGKSVFDIMLPQAIEKMKKTVDDVVIKHITKDYDCKFVGELNEKEAI